MPLSLPRGFVKFQASKFLFGSRQVVRNLKKLADTNMIKELDETLKDFAQKVLDESQEIVPVDTGALKQTGIIEKPSRELLLWRVSYGRGNGAEAPYALVIHEGWRREQDGRITVLRMKNGKKPKYVQQPFEDSFPDFKSEILSKYHSLFANLADRK